MKKSFYYIGLIVVLLIANLMLLVFPKRSISNGISKVYFREDDLSALESISFRNRNQLIKISKGADHWVLNDSLKVDEGFFNSLVSILERVETTRKINNWEGKVLGEISLTFPEYSMSLSYASNPTQTKSYFIKKDQVSEVSVPGYRDNVADLFELHPDQWQDRLIFDGSWRTIQKIAIDQSNGADLEITFNDKFYIVNGQQPQDSSAVIDYLNQYQYFQANEMISKGRFSELDSLVKTAPIATITIDDIKIAKMLVISIYPKQENQNYHLVTLDNKMMVIDQHRVSGMLASPQDFLSK